MVTHNNPALQSLQADREKFLNFALSLLHDKDAAEEILQRASLKVVSRAATLRDPVHAEAWIYRILRNETADHFRRLAVDARRRIELPANLISRDESPAEPKICACALHELHKLRPNYFEALRATEMNGEPIVRYAARKGLSPNAATVLVHRARKSLRSRLQERCGPCAGAGCFDCTCTA